MTVAIETRRLSVVLTLPEVEALRRHLQPEEGMNDLLRRIVHDRIQAGKPSTLNSNR
jgi:hypothetical protein